MPAPKLRIGAMRERLVIQRSDPSALSVATLTRTGATATATTTSPHGYATNDYVTHAGAAQAAYNVRAKVTVTGATTYTFPVVGTPDTPATGTITAMYYSDAQGARALPWRTLDTVPAEMMPIRASERLQMATIQAVVDYRFRIRARSDLSPTMRVLWTPCWPEGSARHTLEISSVLPWGDGREWFLLECAEVAI